MVKLKAIEVELSDGSTIMVHEPRMQDLNVYLQALPALVSLGKAMSAMQDGLDGIIGIPINIPDAVQEAIFPLFAVMSELSVEEFKALPVMDGLMVLQAFTAFMPKNPEAAPQTTGDQIP